MANAECGMVERSAWPRANPHCDRLEALDPYRDGKGGPYRRCQYLMSGGDDRDFVVDIMEPNHVDCGFLFALGGLPRRQAVKQLRKGLGMF